MEALAASEQTVRLAPERIDLYFKKGHTFRSLGRLEEAQQCYEKARQLRGDVPHEEHVGQAHQETKCACRWQTVLDLSLVKGFPSSSIEFWNVSHVPFAAASSHSWSCTASE